MKRQCPKCKNEEYIPMNAEIKSWDSEGEDEAITIEFIMVCSRCEYTEKIYRTFKDGDECPLCSQRELSTASLLKKL